MHGFVKIVVAGLDGYERLRQMLEEQGIEYVAHLYPDEALAYEIEIPSLQNFVKTLLS